MVDTKMPRHESDPVFATEALNFKAKISLSGHECYAACAAGDWRDGAHDDLVLAVALACWYAERRERRGNIWNIG